LILEPVRERRVRKILTAWAAAAVLATMTETAAAHHSMSIYEFLSTTIEGTVQQFKYINPHSILVLKVTGKDGTPAIWYLEGDAPAMLDRDGFSTDMFHAGDRLKLGIHRLRSGQNGGLWSVREVLEQNGHEFIGHECVVSPNSCSPR
jgi:hypothetical protein